MAAPAMRGDRRAQYVQGPVPRSTVKRKVVMYLGYDGTNYHGFQRNVGVETVSDVLEAALYRAGAISAENMGNLSKVSWIVAARTDKGVSAAGNAVSFKASFSRSEDMKPDASLQLDFRTFVDHVNVFLPSHVRVFGAAKPTGSFSAKDACSGRSYEYLLPLSALSHDCELSAYNEILRAYEGSHSFHNFTIGNEHKIPPPPQVWLKRTLRPR
jgi:tRNA pseudouridine38-40 synthase